MSANQQEWLETLATFKDRREPCAQVLVIGVKGSAPREVGARMLVAGGKLAWGTIGGGGGLVGGSAAGSTACPLLQLRPHTL